MQRESFLRGCLLFFLLPLAGCSGDSAGALKSRLGLAVEAPDPFQTVSRRPLQIPSERASLLPPVPGLPSSLEIDPEEEARAAVLGSHADKPPLKLEDRDLALLKAAKIETKDVSQRLGIMTEINQAAKKDTYLIDRWIGYKRGSGEELDPAVEAARLGLSTKSPPPSARSTPGETVK